MIRLRRVPPGGHGLLLAHGLALLLTLAACARPQDPPAAPPAAIPPPAVTVKVAPLPAIKVVPLPRARPALATPPAAVVPAPKVEVPAPVPVKVTTSAEFVPAGAVQYAPVLAEKQRARWPDAPAPWTLAGLVEQETCASLKSKRCWNPREELKTYREYGFGLGQVTIAYRADGSERFNEFTNLQRKYASLRSWTWDNRYDPGYQLTAIVEMTLALWRQVPPAANDDVHWAFTLVSYNAGLGGLLQDRRLCANSAGCNQTLWFGHIETHSLKSKAPQKAYGGQSWYSISRGYVRNVLTQRRAKYRRFWE